MGTAAITSRGIDEQEIMAIAGFIDQAIVSGGDEGKLAGIKGQVNELMAGRPLFAQGVTS